MRLLILTQVVDSDDPVLGFMHAWIEEFSRRFESIEVVCLREGKHLLPKNVRVYSLGKEKGASRAAIILRLFKYAWVLRNRYGAVFVHMNQEYVLLGGWLWKLLGKKVYFWRNHYAGTRLTDIASGFCTKIFCTSRYSYTARFKKTKFMPIGIDTRVFHDRGGIRRSRTVLFLGRIAPSKRIEILLEALALLKQEQNNIYADIYGDASPQDQAYLEKLHTLVEKLRLEQLVRFYPGVPNRDTPPIYSSHMFFFNGSRSGMYDKTIFEAAACGSLPLASSADFAKDADARLAFDGTPERLALSIRSALMLSQEDEENIRKNLADLVEENSLYALGIRLADEMR